MNVPLVVFGVLLSSLGLVAIVYGFVRMTAEYLHPYVPEYAETPSPVDAASVDDSLDFIRAALFPPQVVAGSDIDAWAGVVQQLPDLAAIDVDRLSEFYLTPKE